MPVHVLCVLCVVPRPSATTEADMEDFRFVGQFIARAASEGAVLDATLSRFVLRRLLGRRPCHYDLHGLDETLYAQLVRAMSGCGGCECRIVARHSRWGVEQDWMVNNPITHVLYVAADCRGGASLHDAWSSHSLRCLPVLTCSL